MILGSAIFEISAVNFSDSTPNSTVIAARELGAKNPVSAPSVLLFRRVEIVERDGRSRRALQREVATELSRCALTQLNASTTTFARNQNGIPVWPTGFAGSISHSSELVGVLAAECQDRALSIGIDLESIRSAPSRGLSKKICTPQERAWLDQDLDNFQTNFLKIFSMKEAIYKATFQKAPRPLRWQDVTLRSLSSPDSFECIPESAPARLLEGVPANSQLLENFIFSVISIKA